MISAATKSVVLVALDQANRPRSLHDATFRSLCAGELGDACPPHDELKRDYFQGLLPVVSDDLPLAVCRTGLLIFGHFELHLIPWQVGWELFVASLPLDDLTALVAVDRF